MNERQSVLVLPLVALVALVLAVVALAAIEADAGNWQPAVLLVLPLVVADGGPSGPWPSRPTMPTANATTPTPPRGRERKYRGCWGDRTRVRRIFSQITLCRVSVYDDGRQADTRSPPPA